VSTIVPEEYYKKLSEESVKESSDELSLSSHIAQLLMQHAVDIVLVAPACESAVVSADGAPKEIQLPPTEDSFVWGGIARREVLFVVKPVDAISSIRTKSWIATRRQQQRGKASNSNGIEWILDGCVE
jgi:hypothetical protein